jgi:hypothetical protein
MRVSGANNLSPTEDEAALALGKSVIPRLYNS